MVGLNSVAAGTLVNGLTYQFDRHTTPSVPVLPPEYESPAEAQELDVVAQAQIDESSPFDQQQFGVGFGTEDFRSEELAASTSGMEWPEPSPFAGVSRLSVPNPDNNLGGVTVRKIEGDNILLFEIGKFPVSDVGACDLALAVIHQLQAKRALRTPVIVQINSVSNEYIPGYSGSQNEEQILHPCCLLDQALPIGSPFLIVSPDPEFVAALKERGYGCFLAETVDQAVIAGNRTWRQAGLYGEEPAILPTPGNEFNAGLEALRERREVFLKKAAGFNPPTAAGNLAAAPLSTEQPNASRYDTLEVSDDAVVPTASESRFAMANHY